MSDTWPATGEAQSERVIDHYRLGRSLGSGSLGEVFEAFDLNTTPPTRVAFKLLHTELATDRQAVAELKHEARTLKNLQHPNILPILDFVVKSEAQQVYLVTPYAKGGTLEKFFQPNPTSDPIPFDCAQVLVLLEPIANALDYAHANGLVHRDIKPANILLDENNQPMLTDFSLSLQLSNLKTGARARRVNLVRAEAWGTPSYAAPEQWDGKVGWPSDVYALGVMVYQLLTGHLPYEGTPDQLKVLHKTAPIPKVSDKVPELHQLTSIDKVIKAALAKDPANRLRSAGALYDGLRQACQTDEEVSLLLDGEKADPQAQLLGGKYLAQWPHDPDEWAEALQPEPFKVFAGPLTIFIIWFFLPLAGFMVGLGFLMVLAPLIPLARVIIFSLVAFSLICLTISFIVACFLYSSALNEGQPDANTVRDVIIEVTFSPFFLLWIILKFAWATYRYFAAQRQLQKKFNMVGEVYIGREGVFQFNEFVFFNSLLDVKYHEQASELHFKYKENETGLIHELLTKVPPDHRASAPALAEFYQQVVMVEQNRPKNNH